MSLKSLNFAVLALAVFATGHVASRDALAAIDVDIDWTSGSQPTDYGYDTNHATVDTGAGTWTNSGSVKLHSQNSLVNDLDPTGDVHGWADIQHLSFSTKWSSVFAIGFRKDNDVLFDINLEEGNIRLTHGEFGTTANITVANTDGQNHRYAWELDRGSSTLKLFFDDLTTPVGNPAGYAVATTNSDTEHWFGDREGDSANTEIWSSFVIKSGNIPEPTTAMLLAGLGLLAGIRRRARR